MRSSTVNTNQSYKCYEENLQLSLGWGRLYWLSLTLKVIQGRLFLFYLKGRMQFPISD